MEETKDTDGTLSRLSHLSSDASTTGSIDIRSSRTFARYRSSRSSSSGRRTRVCCCGWIKYNVVSSSVLRDLERLDRKLRGLNIDKTRLPCADSIPTNIAFSSLIVLNSICIGVDLELADDNGRSWPPMVVLESLFLIVFWVEISLRIYARGFKRFLSDSWGPFDLGVTLLGSTDAWLLTPIIGSNDALSGISALRTLRLLRLARLVRVFRALRILSRLVKVMVGAFQSLVWVTLLLTMAVYVSVICSRVLLTGHENDTADLHRLTRSMGWTLFYHFGAVTAEDYTKNMVYPTVHITALWYVYWVVLVIFLNFFLVNSIVGLIVQKTLFETKEEERLITNFVVEALQFKKTLLTLFTSVDIDEDGVITASQLESLLKDPTLRNILYSFGINMNVPIEMLIVILGVQNENTISFRRFYDSCVRVCGASRDVRSFMLQYDISDMRMTAVKRIRNIAKKLNYQAFDGSLHTSKPPRLDPQSSPATLGQSAHAGSSERQLVGVSDCKLDVIASHIGSNDQSTQSRPGARAVAKPKPKPGTKIVCGSLLRYGFREEFLPLALRAKKRLGVLERRQEEMLVNLSELRVALFGETHPSVITCKQGHPLIPLGTSGTPVGSAAYRHWTCDARSDPSGCQHGPSPGSHLTKLRRYHCSLCRYDLCEDCYNARLMKVGVGRLAPCKTKIASPSYSQVESCSFEAIKKDSPPRQLYSSMSPRDAGN